MEKMDAKKPARGGLRSSGQAADSAAGRPRYIDQ